MPLPDLETICVELTATPQSLSLTFPGGAEIAVQVPDGGIPDQMQVGKQLMAQASAAMAPLVPVFNLLDTVLALFKTVKAIPDAITSLSPAKITDALPDLITKASKLLKLIPQLSVPLMIAGLIDALLAFLEGLKGQLQVLVDQQARIQQAEARAAELGNAQLQGVVGCAKHHVEVQMQSLSESAAPVNRLIALVNVFTGLVGLPSLPNLSDLGPDPEAALAPLASVVQTLKAIRSSIPA
jgi:hypothetical protein